MGILTDRIASQGRQALGTVAGRGSTLCGAAVLLVAAAFLGAAIPQAMQPNELPGSAANAPIKRVPGNYLSPVVGKDLRSTSGASIGQVAGVLVDAASVPRAVIVQVGGFLGVGVRTVAVDWQTLWMPSTGKGDALIADLAPQQLARAPQYKPEARSIPVVTTPAAGARTSNLGYGE